MSKKVRTRFAPSPTGPLHMGGVRTALYCYLFAKKHGGDFLLRIEDTDQTRLVEKAENYIIESLHWCGIVADEGHGFGDGPHAPYKQSLRKDTYRKFADELVAKDWAYYAFDTAEELEEMRNNLQKQGATSTAYNSITRQYMKNSISLSKDEVEERINSGQEYVIRFKMPRNEEVKFNDLIRGWVSFNTAQLDDKVLIKKDGLPTYHLANVVDDHLMEISHVIRGEEWLSSTPLHVMMYKAFGWEQPEMAHLPLILKPDGKGKLSKRDGVAGGFPVFPLSWKDEESGEVYDGYRERGFIPAAFINMLAFLGWNPGTEQEIFSLPELIEAFSIERVGKSGAKFDFEKAKWFNHQYIMRMDNHELAKQILPQLKEKTYTTDLDYVSQVCGLIKERCYFVSEIVETGYYFFEDIKKYDFKAIENKWNDDIANHFSNISLLLSNLSTFNSSSTEETVKDYMNQNNLKMGQVLPIFRIALAGTMQGPPVFEMMELLGKEKTIHRLNIAPKFFHS